MKRLLLLSYKIKVRVGFSLVSFTLKQVCVSVMYACACLCVSDMWN